MIITDIIFFMVLFSVIVGGFSYSMWLVNIKLKELKSRTLKSQILLKSVSKSLETLEAKLSEQNELLDELKKNPPKKYNAVAEDDITQGYARAKSLAQRGLNLDKNSLKSCNLTDEEIELLSETMIE